MLRKLLRKDVLLNARLFWGIVPLLAWMGYALSEPDLSFATSGVIMAFAGTMSACLVGAREDKFRARAVLHSLPVRRRDVVRARYAAALIVGVACFAIVTVMAVSLPWSLRSTAEVLTLRVILFALSCIVATAAVMLPFAIRFGMVGVVVMMGALQFGGMVTLFWAEFAGRRGIARALFGRVEGGLKAVYAGLDQPAFILATAVVLGIGLWVSLRFSIFLTERQEL
jgi:hypothetical protein